MSYDIILADPPWNYGNKATRASADKHYPTMRLEEIKALPVYDLGTMPSALCLWVTWPNIRMAFEVFDAWGYEYKTLLWEWIKLNKDGTVFRGLGNYSRSNPEPCLLAFKKVVTRSRIIPVEDHSISAVLKAQRRKHSQKPDEQYERIERLWPDRRYIELFARQTWPGWDCWSHVLEESIEWMV